ncbi:MAG: hypothetical protein WCO55_06045 [Candidatus Falkowbacteria bacterium]
MKIKKAIYVAMTMLLGWLLSVIIHCLIEILYIRQMLHVDTPPYAYYIFGWPCYLHPVLQLGLILAGLVGGYFLGQTWWRIIYIENRYGWIKDVRRRKKTKK